MTWESSAITITGSGAANRSWKSPPSPDASISSTSFPASASMSGARSLMRFALNAPRTARRNAVCPGGSVLIPTPRWNLGDKP